jgi:hypothetical protein
VSRPTLQPRDYLDAALALDCDVAAVRAVLQVEALGRGFNLDGSPVTLFEGHKFSKFTGGRFDDTHPDISYPVWTTRWYGHSWQAEQDRLQRAMKLNRAMALSSASWGLAQLMGFNHGLAGAAEPGFLDLQPPLAARLAGVFAFVGTDWSLMA